MVKRYFHGDTIEGFLAMHEAQIVGYLTTAHTSLHASLQGLQADVWREEIALLKDILTQYIGRGHIYFEYTIPRMNVNMTAKKNIFPSYSWGLKDHIVANIWNIELGEWEVTLWQNGQKVCEMTNFRDYDYYALYWFCEIYGSSSTSYQHKSHHLYYGKLKDPNAPFEVRAVDRRGVRGPYTCSEVTTNYDGLNGDFETYIPTK